MAECYELNSSGQCVGSTSIFNLYYGFNGMLHLCICRRRKNLPKTVNYYNLHCLNYSVGLRNGYLI